MGRDAQSLSIRQLLYFIDIQPSDDGFKPLLGESCVLGLHVIPIGLVTTAVPSRYSKKVSFYQGVTPVSLNRLKSL